MKLLEDVVYSNEAGERGTGYLYLPDDVNQETCLVLSIHGGWASMNKRSFRGVSEWLAVKDFILDRIYISMSVGSRRFPVATAADG